jgi:small subunit ribosomal protein S1
LKIVNAKHAGFCSGVKKAVESVLAESSDSGSGSVLGPLVHNEAVVRFLEEHAIKTVDHPEAAEGSFLAIRTHGATPELVDNLNRIPDLKIIDLTCPRVKKVQQTAAWLAADGYNIIIFGNPEHPEVKGLLGWAGGRAQVAFSTEQLVAIITDEPAALIAQTTCNAELFRQAEKIFRDAHREGLVYNTICPETKLRQDEVVKLAERVDAFIVVGSETSANTKALFDRCRKLKPACRVNSARELDHSFVKSYGVIGVTAGASTPPWTIKEVVESMENENVEVKSDELFQFDGEVKVALVGEQVTGKVARVTADEVYVDIGSKTEAILPSVEVHLAEGKTLADLFAPEDDIEVTVLENEDQEGKVVVSHKRLAREKRMKELEEAHGESLVTEGTVKQVVGAGLVIDLGSGVEGFMPGSLVDTAYIPDFSVFKDQPLQFKLIEFDREKGKMILSRKAIVAEEESKKKEETLEAIKVGSVISGKVKRLTNFGAFVDIGGLDGLVHVSEIAWERIKHPGEALKVGEQVEVEVLEVIPEKERISLSIRKTLPDPWLKAVEGLESGQIIKGKVTRLANFGAFIELRPGVEGLAHISQLADFHVKHPSEVLQEGEEVEVKVIEIKPKNKRISLSIKEAGGIAYAGSSFELNGADNGNVTLGDVFGDLFENGDYPAVSEKPVQMAEEDEEKVTEAEKE